ncbi:FAD binding domain-containing protein [Hirsutella rhossiliensis]|uniref:FAD binding domain-containing protein n=1 Tax=Hirsutella rhossiliensis TaxID=111463 RepID=A0A9P8N6Y2_9HYPO|nr:FAD binding domain-containing protein [Hirsutella rhossiliensis]KAH0967884.1 FAD binding domain-containing protein [Hirsutella rhossiliensis]
MMLVKFLVLLVAGGLAAENGTASVLQRACKAAQDSLGADQVDTSPLNQTIVEDNWSLSCLAEPYCIILPRNARAISTAIQIIAYFNASFAVRAGGHSPNPGWSSVDKGGILVDLQYMNKVSLTSDSNVASVGPGARWGDVMKVVNKRNVSVVGTRAPDVGVGGSLLGGGYFYLSGYGLATDNVKSFEIVLSSGKIANANAHENDDLFWALKGGGPNFGIVTRYDLNTIPVNKIWYKVLSYPTDQAMNVLDAVAKWQLEGGSSDPKGNIIFYIGLDSILLGLVYAEPLAGQPSCFASFNKLAPVTVAVPATNGTFTSLNVIAESSVSNATIRHDYRGVSSLVDAQLYKDVYKFWLEKAKAVYNTTGSKQTFAIQHVPSSIAEHGARQGGNPMGIPQQTHQWWTTLVDWTDESADGLVRSVAIETTAYWQRLSQERGLDVSYIYMNDAARDQDPIATYGGANVQTLKEIAAKYDPGQVFQRLQNDGFLLYKVRT